MNSNALMKKRIKQKEALLSLLETYFEDHPLPPREVATLLVSLIQAASLIENDFVAQAFMLVPVSVLAKHPYKDEIGEAISDHYKDLLKAMI